METSSKKCVNGNCAIKKSCALYHQAKDVFEASGANGKFVRYSCRKGKCSYNAHFLSHRGTESTEVQP